MDPKSDTAYEDGIRAIRIVKILPLVSYSYFNFLSFFFFFTGPFCKAFLEFVIILILFYVLLFWS